MVKASNNGSGKRRKRVYLSKGFRLSKSRTYRSIIQQLLHSGNSARIGLKLKKRRNRKARTKLLNLFLRTRGTYYARLKTEQKKKAYAVNTHFMFAILIERRNLVRIFIKLRKSR